MVEHFGKSQVRNFSLSLVQEYVLAFKVSVNDSFLVESFEAIEYLFEEIGGFIFGQSLVISFVDIIFKRALVTVLHDNQQ